MIGSSQKQRKEREASSEMGSDTKLLNQKGVTVALCDVDEEVCRQPEHSRSVQVPFFGLFFYVNFREDAAIVQGAR